MTNLFLPDRLELDYLNEKYDLEFPENESETLSALSSTAMKPFPV